MLFEEVGYSEIDSQSRKPYYTEFQKFRYEFGFQMLSLSIMIKGNFLDQLKTKNWLVFFILFGVTLLMRFHTLFPMTIDYDETTYAVMADHMLNGSELYKDVIDIKQPGIFFVFAGIQLLFGKSIIAIRVIAMLAVSSAAFFLFLFKRRIGFDLIPSILSGMIFIFMFNFYFGFSANNELFFVWCVALGILMFDKAEKIFQYLLVGLIFGFGFIIKQHVLFDFAAVGLFFLITALKRRTFKQEVLSMVMMIVGFATPFLICHAYFLLIGNYSYYHFITYEAPGNYSSVRDWGQTIKFLWNGVVLYLPFFLFAFLSLRANSFKIENVKLLFLLLLIFDLIGVGITGQIHPHYYLQLAIPISFAAGEIASLNWVKSVYSKRMVQIVTIILLIGYATFLGTFYHKRYIQRPNVVQQLHGYLESKIKPETSLYTGDAPQLLYWLFDKKSPTPYVHSSLMLNDSHIQTLGITVENELSRIFYEYPDYIILSENYRYNWFKDLVVADYELEETILGYGIYRLK